VRATRTSSFTKRHRMSIEPLIKRGDVAAKPGQAPCLIGAYRPDIAASVDDAALTRTKTIRSTGLGPNQRFDPHRRAENPHPAPKGVPFLPIGHASRDFYY